MIRKLALTIAAPFLWVCLGAPAAPAADTEAVHRNVLLPRGPDNPRNSEGDFATLKDGRIIFVYTHFTGGYSDHATAHLAARYSSDGGKTWTRDDVTVLENEGGQNVMSVSLLRLQNGKLALAYLRKDSIEDCRPILRISTDEARTWGDPIEMIPEEIGYYILNNDRLVQLRGGRLLAPVALHNRPGYEKPEWTGRLMCYLSDDSGKTWRRSSAELLVRDKSGKRVTVQEPGVVELRDGRLMMFARSYGRQYVSFSTDGGDHWSPLTPSNIQSPVSPATIERIPSTGDLLLVWNNHANISPELKGKRTPYNAAISRDDGATWENIKTLEDDPSGWYCYTAMDFVDDRVLLGHCAGNRRNGGGLSVTQITAFPVSWLYAD